MNSLSHSSDWLHFMQLEGIRYTSSYHPDGNGMVLNRRVIFKAFLFSFTGCLCGYNWLDLLRAIFAYELHSTLPKSEV